MKISHTIVFDNKILTHGDWVLVGPDKHGQYSKYIFVGASLCQLPPENPLKGVSTTRFTGAIYVRKSDDSSAANKLVGDFSDVRPDSLLISCPETGEELSFICSFATGKQSIYRLADKPLAQYSIPKRPISSLSEHDTTDPWLLVARENKRLRLENDLLAQRLRKSFHTARDAIDPTMRK